MKKKYSKMNSRDTIVFPGKMLVAMPYMQDSRFHQSVIYICGHDSTGSMGLVLNKPLSGLVLSDLLKQVNVPMMYNCPEIPVIYGGPIEVSRGFVLHSLDYHIETTVVVDDTTGVTSTLDVLKALGQGNGPVKTIVTLGYVSWNTGQLEAEMAENMWLLIQPTEGLVFDVPFDMKWRMAMASIGVDPAMLVLDCGHA
ncbi:MAG: YqgE/AlgH family protein [Candidatus Paracaedibacteraceae bacterium]|nr:YqgE/AlgH family protein [Candidatus Paracaedibacteraceae bacterium]